MTEKNFGILPTVPRFKGKDGHEYATKEELDSANEFHFEATANRGRFRSIIEEINQITIITPDKPVNLKNLTNDTAEKIRRRTVL